ncbi:MAG: hypothetical protein CVU57_28775 [Deltaproteobacteria bacterium HGW-Deltaproteobacteria-15]|jgi:hypothetical protein|nr:MAG: hypothetical protein CVU57_28775 [Deltaproteobacteria bacterium HGW-Deltaproteobacteria-15]
MNRTKAEVFRARGSDILKGHITGISDFLNDSPISREDPHLHKAAIPQMHATGSVSDERPDTLGRLHLQVRSDLIDKILEAVFKRKRDPKFKGRASQRSVVEDALDHYFEKSEDDAVVTGGG